MSDGLCQGQLSVHVHQRETVRQRPSTLQRRWVPRIVFIECCIIDTVVLYIYHSPTLTCTKDFVDFPALRAERVLKTKDLHANPGEFWRETLPVCKLASPADVFVGTVHY